MRGASEREGGLTPDTHHEGEDDRGAVIKQVGDVVEVARLAQLTELAVLRALRAHQPRADCFVVTDLTPARESVNTSNLN